MGGGVEYGLRGGSRRNKRCTLTTHVAPSSPCLRPPWHFCRCYWLLCGGGRTAGGLGQVSLRGVDGCPPSARVGFTAGPCGSGVSFRPCFLPANRACSARDVVRPEAAEAVALLGSLGCTAAMLTGDAAAAAAAVGAAAGIPPKQVHARLLPEDKLAKVTQPLHWCSCSFCTLPSLGRRSVCFRCATLLACCQAAFI